MYFYRLMTKEELKTKKIHNNKNSFSDCINTHKYKRSKNYIHLFLNAESCFEDFDKKKYSDCIIAKFDIPEDIICKYGIGLGGYNLIYNSYNKKYRVLNFRNSSGGYSFWLPEIAISEDDFNYNWCKSYTEIYDKKGNIKLPEDYITNDLYYRDIVMDGYLLGYNSEQDLLKKYEKMIELKKRINLILKTTRKIILDPQYINCDSINAINGLINFALENSFIRNKEDIRICISDKISKGINITDRTNISSEPAENYIIINRNIKDSATFCSHLNMLGIKTSNEYNKVYDELIDEQIKNYVKA